MAVIKKNLRDYTPGQNDFLHFAKVMNNNAALDLNRSNANMSPLQTENVWHAPKITTAETVVDAVNVDNLSETEPLAAVTTGAETASAETAGAQGAETEGEDTLENVVSANKVSSGYQYDMLDENEWYASQGLDPETDYQNTVNMLNYEYQTSMATYGQNAENLYQLGLQNSGVSDIFQSNAFSTYLANMNAAAAAKIEARKQNKALYNTYVQGVKAQRESVIQSAMGYVSTQLNAGYTDPEKLKDQVQKIYNLSNEELARISGVIDVEAEEAKANIIEDVKLVLTDRDGIVRYTGSNADKTYVKNSLGNKYTDNMLEQAFAELDAQLAESKRAEIKDFAALDVGSRVLDSSQIEYLKKAAKDNEDNKTEIQNALANDINYVLGDEKGLENGYNFAGVTEEEWNAMSDEDKVNTILNKMSQLKKEDLISEEQWKNVVADHIGTTFESAREEISRKLLHKDEKDDNRYSFDIMETSADLALFYKEQKEQGLISDDDYQAACRLIYDQLDDAEQRGLYKNMQVYTENASDFDKFVEGVLQNSGEGLEDLDKTAFQLMSQIFQPAQNVMTEDGPEMMNMALLCTQMYNAARNSPQEAGFLEVWHSLDEEGKHALADIYMSVEPENRKRLENTGVFYNYLKDLAVANAEYRNEKMEGEKPGN